MPPIFEFAFGGVFLFQYFTATFDMHEVMEEEAFLSTLKEAIQLLIEGHSIHTKLATECLVLKYNAM